MALIKCPECQKDISDTAVSCPNCGHRLKTMFNQTRNIIITIIVVIVVSISFAVIYNVSQNSAQSQSSSVLLSDETANVKSEMDAASKKYEQTGNKDDLQQYEDYNSEYLHLILQ